MQARWRQICVPVRCAAIVVTGISACFSDELIGTLHVSAGSRSFLNNPMTPATRCRQAIPGSVPRSGEANLGVVGILLMGTLHRDTRSLQCRRGLRDALQIIGPHESYGSFREITVPLSSRIGAYCLSGGRPGTQLLLMYGSAMVAALPFRALSFSESPADVPRLSVVLLTAGNHDHPQGSHGITN